MEFIVIVTHKYLVLTNNLLTKRGLFIFIFLYFKVLWPKNNDFLDKRVQSSIF